jgi:hypothetical protein
VILPIPNDAQFVTVEFARREGGTHKQRVTLRTGTFANKISDVIAAAIKGCKRRKVAVANVQRITHGKAVLFDYVTDTAARLR